MMLYGRQQRAIESKKCNRDENSEVDEWTHKKKLRLGTMYPRESWNNTY